MDPLLVANYVLTGIFIVVAVVGLTLAIIAIDNSNSTSESSSSSSSDIIIGNSANVNYLLMGYGNIVKIEKTGLRLTTKSMTGPNPLNFFNGGGLGNKTMLSIDYPGKVTDFKTLSFSARMPYPITAINFYVNILIKVDLSSDQWNNALDAIVVLQNPTVDLVLNSEFKIFTFNFDSPIYASVGARGNLPNFQPPPALNSAAPLTQLTSATPDAIFFNGKCLDNGFPRTETHAGAINLVLGDSVNTSFMVADIGFVKIDSTLYEFK